MNLIYLATHLFEETLGFYVFPQNSQSTESFNLLFNSRPLEGQAFCGPWGFKKKALDFLLKTVHDYVHVYGEVKNEANLFGSGY